MRSRNRSIRFKIFLLLLLPLLSLSALWGFVLNLTVGDGQALLRAGRLYQTLGVTSTDLGLQLQAERADSALASGKRAKSLGAQRERTDTALQAFTAAVAEADDEQLRPALRETTQELDRLDSIRASVDTGLESRLTNLNGYNRLMDALFRLYEQLTSVPDLPIFQQAGAIQAMSNAREIIARENALIGGVLADGEMTEAESAAFTEYVATRKFLHARALSTLDAELRGPYDRFFAGAAFSAFALAEARVAATGGPPPRAEQWTKPVADVTAQLDRLGAASAKILAERSDAVATTVMIRIAVAGGVGLLAVIASIVISVRFGRRLSSELAGLRSAALDLAEVRLPHVVTRLRGGEEVNVRKEAPPLKVSGAAEILDVAKAFGSVQRTAVEAAVGQANLRRGIGQVFLNLARRKQGLLHRQLTLLDGMQRRTHDPGELDDLFRLDHLTTRMRRHAEGLIILSGSAPGRVWRQPVPALDVVRAATAEVEDYTRISVQPMPTAALDGSAAADLVHLVAELLENATIYSPPNTTVQVRGDSVSNGYAIEIEDRGLGLAPEEYDRLNALLVDPPEFDLADSDRLGLFVVARLAARHGVSVTVRASPFGGTTAIVLIPRGLLVEQPALPPADAPKRDRKPLALVGGTTTTHKGLPRRVRQANLAPQLKAPEQEPRPERSPDEVRDLFSAFQRGTQRGREEEAQEGDL
ncbi:nitrate- and nitrite sensing domain-containing protein [Nonomuraea africana]|uniref:histidine kinase n=1 Tax=Nonomuraea africana TaxID=46171 RepID=A0ABR9KRN0_9ACTN|nr:nitrate- and nitrite sensing domain-containing protein [Nonomuraea africana]MBE1564683.1 signal transduction histidine kinase [Nonomuraea africana]